MQVITEAVTLEKKGAVGVLWIDNPPVNALGYPVRKGLSDGIDIAVNDDEIRAVVIICKGRTFCAGADIREMGKPPVEPHLPDVLNRIDQSDKPVIAALHGTALGGGMETALGCHFRIAVSSAKMGLPEVKLGLIPAAGGTQRLPRLIGPEKALNMILAGDPMDAATALAEGVIDEVVQGDLADAALSFARRILEEGKPLLRVSAMTDKIAPILKQPGFFDHYRQQIAESRRGFDAPRACIQAVEAAVLRPFPEGCRFERELFLKLRAGDQSAAQRYYFFAERAAAKIPDIEQKTTSARPIETAGIVGGGALGHDIAVSLMDAAIHVTLAEPDEAILGDALSNIRRHYMEAAAKGKIDDVAADEHLKRITGATRIEDLANADIVIEAVEEEMDVKRDLFARLDAVCKEKAVLAAGTAALNIDDIASATKRPESVVGLHFLNPLHTVSLMEIVRGQKTDKTVLMTAMALVKKLKKTAIMVGSRQGLPADKMFGRFKQACSSLIHKGAFPKQISKVLYDFGFPIETLTMSDLPVNIPEWKTETSSEASVGKISDDKIIEQCIYPVINECAGIIEEKIALRPSDLDVIWVKAFGWPLYRGGPMFYADLVGLEKILESLKAFQEQYGDDFTPAPLLEQLVKEGNGFSSLN